MPMPPPHAAEQFEKLQRELEQALRNKQENTTMATQNQNQNRNNSNDDDYGNLIPDGDYDAVLIAHDFGESSNGTEQIGMQFRIVQEGEYNGRIVTYYGYFTENATKITFKAMRACGWQGNDITDCSTMYVGKGGQKVSLRIEIEEDPNGEYEPRSRVKWVNGIGVAMKHKYEGGDLAKLAARLKGAAMANGGNAQSGQGSRQMPPAGNNRGGQQNARGGQGNGQRQQANDDFGRDVPPPGDDDEPQFNNRGRRG